MLGQVKVENKSNEITAIPALLELLDITGCIITIDQETSFQRSLKQKAKRVAMDNGYMLKVLSAASPQ